MLIELADEESGNQVSGDDEEDIDPNKPSRESGDSCVVEQNEDDGERS